MSKRSNSFKAVGSVIDKITEDLNLKPRLDEYYALLSWEEVVGKQIANVTRAVKISKGILYIQVKTSTWRNELVLRKKEIIDRLNTKAGTQVIKDIKFQ